MIRIPFQPDMVRAIAGGRKMQTRRLRQTLPVGTVFAVGEGLYRATRDNSSPLRTRILRNLTQGQIANLPLITRYQADGAIACDGWRWKVSAIAARYCPAALCRYRCEVTAVRSEQLQAISEDDAHAEGFDSVADFAARWIEIHSWQSWRENPVLNVVTFRPTGGQ